MGLQGRTRGFAGTAQTGTAQTGRQAASDRRCGDLLAVLADFVDLLRELGRLLVRLGSRRARRDLLHDLGHLLDRGAHLRRYLVRNLLVMLANLPCLLLRAPGGHEGVGVEELAAFLDAELRSGA